MNRKQVLSVIALVVPMLTGSARAEIPDSDPRVTPVVRAYRKAKPAVVNISTEKVVATRGPMGDDPFDAVFPSPFRRRVPVQSLGSGFIIHPSGYVITNAHVVRRARKITVTLSDDRRFSGEVISADPAHDLAVVKIEPENGKPLPHFNLGRSDDILVGETVIAVGNPLGYSNTVSRGIVSATGRSLDFPGGIKMTGLIQTDASINPGNSGGPLLNIKGELIGITTAIRADAQNIGFAIPVDELVAQLRSLLDFEHVNRVMFGATVEQKRAAGSSKPTLVVTKVKNASPAAGKLRPGDIIRAIDGTGVDGMADYVCEMMDAEPGKPLSFDILRDGKQHKAAVTIKPMPKPDGSQLARKWFGLTVKEVTRQVARDYRLPVARGLVVVGVAPGSPASRIGLRKKDVIFQVGRFYVNNADDLGMILENVTGGDVLRVGVVRGNIATWIQLPAARKPLTTTEASPQGR
ncbi:MAG: trypsin-like peptidase domain-containing protein [Phycisphaerae bacterium]